MSASVSNELRAIWLYAFRDWLRQSSSFRDALDEHRLSLPVDLRELVDDAARAADDLAAFDSRVFSASVSARKSP